MWEEFEGHGVLGAKYSHLKERIRNACALITPDVLK
jgi:hypothetical protein